MRKTFCRRQAHNKPRPRGKKKYYPIFKSWKFCWKCWGLKGASKLPGRSLGQCLTCPLSL